MTSSKSSRAAKAAGWVAAGAVGATVLTGIAFAADGNTPTPTPGSSTTAPESGTATPPGMGDGRGPGGPGMGEGRGPGMGGPRDGMGRGLGKVLHGDVTVEGEDGTAQLTRIQRGTVESVSGTSLTVKSSDGYTSTWTINDDTTVRRDRDDAAIGDVVVGDTVIVRGPVADGTATAKVVRALSPEALAELEARKAERDAQRGDDGAEDAQGSDSSTSASFDLSTV